jgi:hypothetical protein
MCGVGAYRQYAGRTGFGLRVKIADGDLLKQGVELISS